MCEKFNINDFEILDIDDIQTITQDTTMYDMEVDDDNTFYISKNQKDDILVHNCDGNHIRGLLINLFDTYWPELLKMDFIYDFVTPIVKASKGNKIKYYYRLDDYRKDKDLLKDYEIKWIKGLGTINPDEMKSFFRNINKHLIRFHYDPKSNTEDLVDLIFNKKRSDDRKNRLDNYIPTDFIDKFAVKQTYDKFINSELMEWSMADNNRVIPSVIDGLKPGQRKVIYTLFKKGNRGEIKVSSLSGAIIQEAAYHNGNTSIEQAIIGMAQNFVGSNNLNLILPKGQFGSRLKGGSDSASSRYIFTKLSEITEYIFIKEDNNILTYLDDDGFPIEPKYYVPIIPMILINGAKGIGSGYSTEIPSYNPVDIITYLQNKLKNKKNIELNPFYKEFKGEIIMDIENRRYITRGLLKKLNDTTYEITELPIGMWNSNYYEFLDDLSEDKKDVKGRVIRKALIRDWNKTGNDREVKIKIYFYKDISDEFFDNLFKNLRLETYISFGNMHLFDKNKKIKKYNNQYEIIDDFYEVRMEYYEKRKDFLLEKLKQDTEILKNKILFIKNVVDDKIIINKKSRDAIEKNIEDVGIVKINNSYSYLLNMSISSLTKEKVIELKGEYDKKRNDLKLLKDKLIEDVWLEELEILKKELKKI